MLGAHCQRSRRWLLVELNAYLRAEMPQTGSRSDDKSTKKLYRSHDQRVPRPMQPDGFNIHLRCWTILSVRGSGSKGLAIKSGRIGSHHDSKFLDASIFNPALNVTSRSRDLPGPIHDVTPTSTYIALLNLMSLHRCRCC